MLVENVYYSATKTHCLHHSSFSEKFMKPGIDILVELCYNDRSCKKMVECRIVHISAKAGTFSIVDIMQIYVYLIE